VRGLPVRKLTLSLAVMAALLPVHGYSLGLGELELNSALNQELNAEIEVLSAASEDAEQIIIKLASREAFSRAGLDRPFLLQQLKFKMIDKNGTPYVKVFTKSPVREPFLSFLLEIDWPQGHLLREYTLLLDPPVYNSGSTSSAPANTSGSFSGPAGTQVQNQPVSSGQQSAQSVQSSAQATSNNQSGVISSDSGRSVNYQYQSLPAATSSPDQYRVQQNDTLWSIANRMRPDSSVSVEQMMLALVRKNPEAFIQENVNGVKRGYILRAPSRDEITQLNRQEAVAQAREHSALWREYSQGAASSSPASSMEAEAGDDTAAEQPRDADGHLSIVGASDAGSESAGSNQDPDSQLSSLKQDLAMAQEQLESERLEKEDLRSRLAELEQRVQRVIEMDDGELAKLQQDLQDSKQEAEPAEAAVQEMPEEEVSTEELVDAAPEEQPAEEVMTEEVPEEGMDELVEEAEDAPTTDGEAIFVDEVEGEIIADEMAESEATVQPVDVVEPPAFAKEKSKGFFADLMNNPSLLGMIGGALALVLLLVALLLKRIRGNKAEEDDEWSEAMGDSSDLLDLGGESESSLASAGEDDTVIKDVVDMNTTTEMMVEPAADSLGMEDTHVELPGADDNLEDTVFNLDKDESEEGDDDPDDVIAEADVYLAYGIYQQAEELLNKAIDENPERDDYRMKLLETHFAAKNASGFEQLAEDVKSRKAGDKSYWDRVVAMGMELCPGNSLFSSENASLSDFDHEALLPDKPQATDLDLDAGDDSSAAEFDLGLDDLEETPGSEESLEAEELGSLDDELDLAGDLEDIASEVEEVSDESLAMDETSSNLEFDLGELGDMEELEESDSEPAGDVDDSADLDIDDDFSLDFDASDLGFEETEDEAESEEINLDADLDLAEGLDSGLEDSDDESSGIDLSDELGDELGDDLGADLDEGLGDIEIDGDELDLGDIDLGDTTEIDLGDSADIDLGEQVEDDAGDMDFDIDSSDDLSGDDDFDISELSEEVDEVSTKLDLAKAYIDMGDNDGARGILEEVKAEGNADQQKQAEELLQQAD